ncbi:hypothetical protein K2V61_12255 [Staphylococcus simulans]|uniref:hypothetical protein n=1 Tax=Staphylococcus simulans TaxID=1286 RepID=UPI001E55BBA7|nr:hypothetical protein [Staphylococcus simulans]MCD8916311.1 hypothetical protein [Staphylococcus simulans]
MIFNNWKINIKTSKEYEVVTNSETLVILEDKQHASTILKVKDSSINVKSLGFGNEVMFNMKEKEIDIYMFDEL